VLGQRGRDDQGAEGEGSKGGQHGEEEDLRPPDCERRSRRGRYRAAHPETDWESEDGAEEGAQGWQEVDRKPVRHCRRRRGHQGSDELKVNVKKKRKK
jgi:hypothetical protein